jgi:predicted Na+-dependent transporter
MKATSGTYVRALIVGFAAAFSMMSGFAWAGSAVPEIDPGMATGGLTMLGVGVFLLIERYRARN